MILVNQEKEIKMLNFFWQGLTDKSLWPFSGTALLLAIVEGTWIVGIAVPIFLAIIGAVVKIFEFLKIRVSTEREREELKHEKLMVQKAKLELMTRASDILEDIEDAEIIREIKERAEQILKQYKDEE